MTVLKSLNVWIMKNCEKLGIPDHLFCLLQNLYVGQEATVRTLYGTTGLKLRKEYDRAVWGHPVNLIYMLSTL